MGLGRMEVKLKLKEGREMRSPRYCDPFAHHEEVQYDVWIVFRPRRTEDTNKAVVNQEEETGQ